MEHLYIEPVNSNTVYEHTILDAQIQDTISKHWNGKDRKRKWKTVTWTIWRDVTKNFMNKKLFLKLERSKKIEVFFCLVDVMLSRPFPFYCFLNMSVV